jgi:hypothetical protein
MGLASVNSMVARIAQCSGAQQVGSEVLWAFSHHDAHWRCGVSAAIAC